VLSKVVFRAVKLIDAAHTVCFGFLLFISACIFGVESKSVNTKHLSPMNGALDALLVSHMLSAQTHPLSTLIFMRAIIISGSTKPMGEIIFPDVSVAYSENDVLQKYVLLFISKQTQLLRPPQVRHAKKGFGHWLPQTLFPVSNE